MKAAVDYDKLLLLQGYVKGVLEGTAHTSISISNWRSIISKMDKRLDDVMESAIKPSAFWATPGNPNQWTVTNETTEGDDNEHRTGTTGPETPDTPKESSTDER